VAATADDRAEHAATAAPTRDRMRGFPFADLRGHTDFPDTRGDHSAAGLLDTYRFQRSRVEPAPSGAATQAGRLDPQGIR
jgi:hypothetical protein